MRAFAHLDSLRRRRRSAFTWINATQFFGAFNDNLFKMFAQMFVIGLMPDRRDEMMSVATILFALPYLFVTAYAGWIADRFRKNTVTVALKIAELAIMVFGIAGFCFASPPLLFATLFFMSLQSALYSPTKYGILPELVEKDRLGVANSRITIWTYLAIILGSAAAPQLAQAAGARMESAHAYTLCQGLCVLVAVAGIFTATRIWRVRPANPESRFDPIFIRRLWHTFRWVRKDRFLLRAVYATGVFSLVTAFMQIGLVSFGIERLGLSPEKAAFLIFHAAIGIAAGAWIAGRLSRRSVEFALLPIGALLLSAMVLAIGLVPADIPVSRVAALIFCAGIGCGLFIVPLDTFLQLRLPDDRRGEGLALNSFVSWIGVLLAGVLMALFKALEVPVGARLFILSGIAFATLVLPAAIGLADFLLRFVVTLLVRTIFRIRTEGIENVPVSGPAILLANHASYFDALLLCATSNRRIRFLMAPEVIRNLALLRPFIGLYKVIPVSIGSSPARVAAALREARGALEDGFLVGIFPEGGMTHDGQLRHFHRGFEKIAAGIDGPVVPVAIRGSWKTLFFYDRDRFNANVGKFSRHRFRVSIVFGAPLREPTAEAAKEAIGKLLANDPS